MSDVPRAPFRDRQPGNAALLIIDMVNCFDFENGDKLRRRAAEIIDPILHLRAQVEAAGWPVVYVNDNFGEWHSERSLLVDRALAQGGDVVDRIRPHDADYFIIKPHFSGFYATNLPLLLPKLGVSRLIVAGIATDICILFTAGDAHMRDYDLWVPRDAVAAASDERGRWALEIMANSMGARTSATGELSLADWTSSLAAS